MEQGPDPNDMDVKKMAELIHITLTNGVAIEPPIVAVKCSGERSDICSWHPKVSAPRMIQETIERET